ncbi:PREDICTED: inositol 1,4,5-trisphosphate receptor type 1-like isoform X1 [Amphimedon queenslandica]|uniref:Inositol 1,4,5-trisphosphate receptor n=1 Tax=Amphimedon queenslandica TaxID=400682 RepID=A0A1X7VBQ9_AMPQE|nr:PREDICTED: inositol 1,4,5-trisphosphate receptor type 1-like isoform X1 [Amphimedon queenslandica]|eukprot:XP_019849736.1 PREDICTED: inositol 1,4,5-trisphosphate receptor type 1-like isoform X1 [Amphimedon queenslandica]
MAGAGSARQTSLRIGDTVLFQVSSGRESREKTGYIYSELSSSPFNFMTVYPVNQGSELEPDFPNIAFATFKVMVPNKYKAKQRLQKLMEEKRKKQASAAPDSPTGSMKNRSESQYTRLLHQAKEQAEEEEMENAQEQARRAGTKVVYGDLIQLQHVASGKFVNVRSEASKTESNNLLVNLSEENSDGCSFVILPRYKVRSEGDEIRFSDQMKLESFKTKGQFLSCSFGQRTLYAAGFYTHPNFYELNLSATESALTLIPHSCPSVNKHPDNALRAGGVVRLFHREDECYIVAEGSFANDATPTENVHCRQRRVDQRKHGNPSTSANTYWQIEKEEDPRTGEVLYWEERCRLKHLPTRLYLAVCKDERGNYEVTLKRRKFDATDLDTLFSFHALIEEGIEVLLESYARIKHLVSGRWLHLVDEKYTRKNFDPTAVGLAGLQWDFAELFQLTTSKNEEDYDAFTLQEVPFDLLRRFNYVAGISPVLTSHIKFLQSGNGAAIPQKQASRVKQTIAELKDSILTLSDRDTKNNQKLLRNIQVVEQLTEILKVSQSMKLIPSLHHSDVCRECYNVIQKFLEGDSRKNENYLARYLEFFQTQVQKGLDAEEVLVEIVQDNLKIVTRMAETRMTAMIDQFIATKDARFLDFLSSLCVCSGRPIPSTQDRLLTELVIRYGRELLYTTNLKKKGEKNEEVAVYYRPKDSSHARDIRSLKPNSTDPAIVDDYELLKGQLHMFGKLCKGNNKRTLDFLVIPRNRDGYVSFDQVFHCAQNTSIDPELRKCYVELILVMFVDVDDNRPFLDQLCYSFKYEDLSPDPYGDTGDDEDTALTGVANLHFKFLKLWFVKVITDYEHLCCNEENIEKNELFAEILNVLGNLVRNGYYDSEEDIDELMKPLVDVLDGTTDKLNEGQNESSYNDKIRKEDTKVNRAVFYVKRKALEVMELFFRFKFYVKLQKFLNDFKMLEGSGGRMLVGRKETRDGPPHDLRQLKVGIDPARCHEWLQSSEMTKKVRLRLGSLCEGAIKGSFHDGHIPKLESVLLDLSEYDCDELVTASLDLLTQMYFFEEQLFQKAQQSQLLICQESIAHYDIVNELLPELRHLLLIDPDQKDQDRIKVILTELSNLLIISDYNDEPNRSNQIMLDNFGILDDILSYILSKGSEGSEATVQQEVFQKCFHLLRRMTAEYKNVQERLFNRIEDLLSVKIPEALADLADLLTEMFTGGAELALRVMESHVDRIFEIIVDCQNGTVQAHFMITLEAMAKIEELDINIKSTQGMIVKNFCRYRNKFCHEVLGEGDKFAEDRLKILKRQEETPQLQLLLSVIDLLAACAEGKHLFIESVCQNILSIDELIKIVSEPLSPLRKKPFVRFLISVYMSSDRDQEDRSGSGVTLSHGGVIWTYLDHLAELLKDTAGAIHMINFEESKAGGRRQHLKTRKGIRPSSQFFLPPLKKVIPGVTDSKGVLVPGLLDYLIEGVIPFLHIYYCSYFSPASVNNEQQRDMEYETSIRIAQNMITLRKELLKVSPSEHHVQMFREIILSLHCHERIAREANIDAKVESMSVVSIRQQVDSKRKSYSRQKSVRIGPVQSISLREQLILEEKEIIDSLSATQSPALPHRALMKYKDQQKLNSTFKTFSRNYQLAYVGLNTAKEQIKSEISEKYSEEGEELPLGPNFQCLVQLYIDRSGPTCKVSGKAEMLLKQLTASQSRTEQLGEREQIIQDVLDVRCLQILRALIHNQIMRIDPELKDRDPTIYRSKSNELIVPFQDAVQSYCGNAMLKIISLLSHTNESISKEAIALMKTMLFSGNENVQEGLAQSVKDTREETLFINLKEKLENASVKYKETRDLQLILDGRKNLQSSNAEKKMSQSPSAQVAIAIEEPVVRYTPQPDDDATQMDEALTCIFDQSEKPELLAYDTSWTNLVLEVIRYMCDGQNRTLQHYLREQPDNFKTVNVVAEVTSLLHVYTSDLTVENLSQIDEIIQALVEMCVGNTPNQRVIFEKQVNEPLNRLLGLSVVEAHQTCGQRDTDQCPKCKYLEDLVKVKGSVVQLLDAMLENTSSQTQEITEGIGSTIDVQSLLDTMSFFCEFEEHPLMLLKEMNDDCERGMFRSYHILVSLMGSKAIEKIRKDKLQDDIKGAYEKCHENTRTIEIHFKDEETSETTLARVHFPHNPDDSLREAVTELVRWSIDRDSMEDKQRALLDLMPALKRDIIHQRNLNEKKVLKPLLMFPIFRYRLLMFLTVLLNLFVLFVYKVPTEATGVHLPMVPEWFIPYMLFILGGFHLILSLWVFIEYFIINWPHFSLPSFVNKIHHYIAKKRNPEGTGSHLVTTTCLDVGIFGVKTLYMFVFLLSSILSLGLSGYFYCICLLFIIANNDILKRVLRAVTKNGISLIWVAVLGIIVLFIYAVISFAFLHQYFKITDDASLYCKSLLECMYSVLRYGLIDNIGLLIPLNATEDGNVESFSAQFHIPRLIFDLSFFIIVITIGLNIVFGIIVDTFSELRGERSDIEKDQKSQCFVCDLPSHEFERKAKGFNNHVKHDHNMWDYVYYSLYLDNIDTGDQNAIQKYVYQLIEKKQTKFFPQQEAICLAVEENTTDELIESLIERVEYVVQHFKDKEQVKSVTAKKQKQKNWEEKFLGKTPSFYDDSQ